MFCFVMQNDAMWKSDALAIEHKTDYEIIGS